MIKLKSNASILSLLTFSKETEKVIFTSCKQVEDIAPKTIFWYEGKGKNGKAEFLWEEKKLKQWFLIGNDKEIYNIWKQLISGSFSYTHSWGNKTIKFELPTVKIKLKDYEDSNRIKDIPVCGRNSCSDEYDFKTSNLDLSSLIGEVNNCLFIEGYQSHKKIKPLFPYGLLEKNSLNKYIEKNVCAVFEKRNMYYNLKGDRDSLINGDPIKYNGFIQIDNQFKSEHEICIRDIEGDERLGKGNITETGKWEIQLSKPISQGQFLIRNKKTKKNVCGEKFYLITDIKINSEIVHTVLKDLYGREINISKYKKIDSEESMIWVAAAAPNNIQSEIELSDRLTNILLSIGKKIIINDPYFFGDFNDDENQLLTSTSQKIFLNALVIAIAKGKVEEIILIGYWKKAKNFINGDKDSFIKKYKILSQLIRKTFENSHLLNLKKLDLIFSSEPFHDRYWVGENIIYHVSNSINGTFESGELKVTQEKELNYLKIKPRVKRRYDNGEKINIF